MTKTRTVTIIRRLRDGSETREAMSDWLADLVVGAVAECEPNTASIRVVQGNQVAEAKPLRQPDPLGVALALAGAFVQSGTTIH